MKFRAALAQIDSKVGNLSANVDHHLEYIDAAIKAGCELILFPELSLTGYTVRDLAWDLATNPSTDPMLEPLRERSKSITIVAGFVESAENHGIYNSAFLMEDGVVKHVHQKIYPPTYGNLKRGDILALGEPCAHLIQDLAVLACLSVKTSGTCLYRISSRWTVRRRCSF